MKTNIKSFLFFLAILPFCASVYSQDAVRVDNPTLITTLPFNYIGKEVEITVRVSGNIRGTGSSIATVFLPDHYYLKLVLGKAQMYQWVDMGFTHPKIYIATIEGVVLPKTRHSVFTEIDVTTVRQANMGEITQLVKSLQ